MRCASRALAEHFKCSATRWLSSWSRQVLMIVVVHHHHDGVFTTHGQPKLYPSKQAYIPEPWPSCALPISQVSVHDKLLHHHTSHMPPHHQQASTPPSSWYTDPNMLLHEQDTVFSNSWLVCWGWMTCTQDNFNYPYPSPTDCGTYQPVLVPWKFHNQPVALTALCGVP